MRLIILSFLLLVLAVPAFAAFQGPTDGATTGTVQQVLNATWDDTPLCLEGNILSKVATSNKKYSFQDNTGTMVVEIKDIVFAGQDVGPNTKVRICGKVDKEYTKTNEFEVKQLQVLNR